uniref:Uncharacterized protein n=1 Tax=Anopheles albimanus TaxID=7167 RepID=A0A182FWI6_ANOAL
FWGFILLCLAAFAFFEESHFFAAGQSENEVDHPLDRSVPPRKPNPGGLPLGRGGFVPMPLR